MHYKTITLALLEDRPALYEELRRSRTLLSTMERYALELKERHAAWQAQLRTAKPGSEANQIASEAMELAIEELQARLPSASMPSDAPVTPLPPGAATLPPQPPTPPA